MRKRQQAAADGGEKGHGAKSQQLRDSAILALLTQPTLKKASKACGVSERTLIRWTNEHAEFKTGLAAARNAAFQAGMARVQALTATAVETLEELMGEKKYPSVRLGAARTVAELGVHQFDAENIMRKLDEIEAWQREQGAGR